MLGIVARTRPPDRLEQLRAAALRVFAHKGLRRTRMSDIAHEMGVAPGTLYTYVESKEALFHWLVEHGADPILAQSQALPIPTPARGEIEKRLREQSDRVLRLPALEAALARTRVRDAHAELEAIARELYVEVERTRGPADAIERSALDLPELFQVFFVETRRLLFEKLTRYVGRRMRAGHFRAVADPAVAARWLVETIVYFARHRYGDPDPSVLPSDEVVRESVIPLVVASLVPDAPRAGARRTR
jgi:AcrR family transcriptional regulator